MDPGRDDRTDPEGDGLGKVVHYLTYVWYVLPLTPPRAVTMPLIALSG